MSGAHYIPAAEVRLMDMKAPLLSTDTPFHGLRARAQRRAAYTLAVQTAVRWRYGHIDQELLAHSAMLNRIYDMRPLLLNGGRVVPPAIGAASDAFRLYSPNSAASTVTTYRILMPARIATVMPTWRQYLIQDYTVTDRVNPVLLPRNDTERQLWKAAVTRGWKQGLWLAARLFRTNLAALTRDMVGMIRFKRLANQGLVSVPILATNMPRIEVEGRTLEIGRREFRITQNAAWRPESEWRAKR